MLNLLEQAISTDNSEFAAKIIQDALGIESDDDVNYWASRRPSRPIANNAPASSATGCRPKRATSPKATITTAEPSSVYSIA